MSTTLVLSSRNTKYLGKTRWMPFSLSVRITAFKGGLFVLTSSGRPYAYISGRYTRQLNSLLNCEDLTNFQARTSLRRHSFEASSAIHRTRFSHSRTTRKLSRVRHFHRGHPYYYLTDSFCRHMRLACIPSVVPDNRGPESCHPLITANSFHDPNDDDHFLKSQSV